MTLNCHACDQVLEDGERTVRVAHGWATDSHAPDNATDTDTFTPATEYALLNGTVNYYHSTCFHESYQDIDVPSEP